jgi:hypothetical protein
MLTNMTDLDAATNANLATEDGIYLATGQLLANACALIPCSTYLFILTDLIT